MKHSGKARRAAFKLIFWTLVIVGVVAVLGFCATVVTAILTAAAAVFTVLTPILGIVWILFAAFTLYFFRDPTARPPREANVLVSPAHGTVDVIDEVDEPQFMGGKCQRISIFLSVLNVHVQKAPVAGKIVFLKENPGKFLSALKAAECCAHNENVVIGFESSETPGEKIGVRLLSGVLARRIIPWITIGDEVPRGERISLIQFGSRCDLYFPSSYKITAKIGDKVIGGETIMAKK